jgi:hypothetical protein
VGPPRKATRQRAPRPRFLARWPLLQRSSWPATWQELREWRPPVGKTHPALRWLSLVVLLLLIVTLLASFLLDEPLRRTLEARMNQNLRGYRITLGGAHVSVLDLALTLHNLVIRQEAIPEPPVAQIPRLRTSVEWQHLLLEQVVGSVLFDRPSIHVNLPQLRQESSAPERFRDRGWQQALQSIYPVKFNHFEVRDGSIVYID